MTNSKAPLGDGALPELMTGAVGNTDAVAVWDYSTMPPQSPGPCCDYPCPYRVSLGKPPHHQRMGCGQCGCWLRWLPRPRPTAQEGQP